MAYSQNGYTANKYSLMSVYTVPGTDIKVTLRKGDVAVVLLELLRLYHTTVEPLKQRDTGGYNPRSVIGGRTISNHGSGTAVDTRWNYHPLGKRGTFTRKQVKAIRAILAYLDGVVRWGGDYKSRADEMHFEIVGNPAQVAKVADKIRNPKPKPVAKPVKPSSTVLEIGSKGATVKRLQVAFNKVFPAYAATPLDEDGEYGPATARAVVEFQHRVGLEKDGKVGPLTRAKLSQFGIKL